jgi:hypothetical protein
VPNTATGVERYRAITFEGTLLSYSPHPRIACGVLYIHQVAKYRVERVSDGKYSSSEIVVDHPACGGDIFKDIPVGSRVKIKVRVLRKYGVITMHPGIREEERPKIFYVAEAEPRKIVVDEGAALSTRHLTTACTRPRIALPSSATLGCLMRCVRGG